MIDTLRPIRQLLYAVRWAIIAFIFTAAWQVHFSSALVQRVPVMVTAAIFAVITLAFEVAAGKWTQLRRPILSLIADIALVTVVVYFSDGIQSPFYALYYIAVITAAVDFGLSGALICATILAAISIPVDIASPGVRLTAEVIARDLVRTIPYLFLTALITGALRSRMRVLDEAASAMRAERAATDREMEVAARIQRAQLPLEMPTIEGARLAVTYKPAREVGGDLYDFYPVEKDCVGVIMADVSGKGVPAALLVSSCKYSVRENYSEDRARMMGAINQHILSVTTDDTFVTMLYGTLCPSSREFRYVNAGHMPPMIVKAADGEVVCTEYSDPPLGIGGASDYVECCIRLEPGDVLVLYTDGVTDAFRGEDGGFAALQRCLGEMAGSDIGTWGDRLVEKIAIPNHLDDLTMLAIQVA